MTNSNPIESSGSTVEDAIANGLNQLNVSREAVEIEILDEGSKGLFGLGTRDAVVRLTKRESVAEENNNTMVTSISEPEPEAVEDTDVNEEDEILLEGAMDELDLEEDEVLSIARLTVTELLEKMHIDADVIATYQEQEDDRHHRPNVLVEVNGDDLSILIGRQAETLNALQYITRLIVGKELNRGVDLEVDVQGYRARRHEQLRRLAKQMADQAVRTGKRQYLEPMASSDRRTIHIALRDHPEVFTESMGEGSRRKVTIVPK